MHLTLSMQLADIREKLPMSHIGMALFPLSLQGEMGLGSNRNSSDAKTGCYRKVRQVWLSSTILNNSYSSRELKCFILIKVSN